MTEFKFNLDKVLKEIEENDYLKKTGFKELINTSVLILFEKLPKVNKSFEPLQNQIVTLNYEMSDFSKEVIEAETLSKYKCEAYKKALMLVALQRLKNNSFSYKYKEKNFSLVLNFSFLKPLLTLYPVEIKVEVENLPKDEDTKNFIIEDLITSLYNQITIPKEILAEKLKKKGSHLQGGHYVDMKAKHQYDENEKGRELNLSIENQDILRIVEEEQIVMGIKITVSEDRVLNSLLKLLHDKSDKTIGSENFYKGNLKPERMLYGGKVVDYPVLSFSPSELYKEYIGKNEYSGAEALHIRKTLENLAKKNFLVVYKKHKFDEKNNHLIDRIEEYQPLIKIIKFYENLTDEEDQALDEGTPNNKIEKKENVIVSLNHIFIDQIDTKFIEYPNDINQMTVIASGGVRQVTESNVKIRDYLLRELSYGHATCEINEDKLPYVLGLDNYIKSSRKKLIAQKVKLALDFAMNIKLITGYETILGTEGQSKIKFYLNLNF